MSDFYSVLRQSIIDRGLTSPEAREEAYAQARRAMVNRLWAYHPPLAEDEIDHRIGQFDTAVARIEDEVIEVFAARADVAAEDDERKTADEDAGAEDDPDYPTHFGGASDEDVATDDDPTAPAPVPSPAPAPAPSAAKAAPAPRASRRTLDEASRAVELALLDADLDAEPFTDPEPGPASSAHDEDLAGWSEPEEDPEDGDAEADSPPTTAERRREATAAGAAAAVPGRWSPAGARASAAAFQARLRQGVADALPSSERARLRALVGVVVALSILLVGGIVWVLLPRPAPPVVVPPVALQTNVPSGVSDPDTAIRLPKEAIAVTTSFTLFDGQDPTVFESDPDNPVRFDGQFARISTSASSAGAKVIIGAGLSSRLAGRTVRVTLDARSARENGATSMRFAYQSGVAISHWQTANLAADFTELGLVWRVPTLRTNPAGDYIIIEPGIPGSGTAVEVRSVRIDLVDE